MSRITCKIQNIVDAYDYLLKFLKRMIRSTELGEYGRIPTLAFCAPSVLAIMLACHIPPTHIITTFFNVNSL